MLLWDGIYLKLLFSLHARQQGVCHYLSLSVCVCRGPPTGAGETDWSIRIIFVLLFLLVVFTTAAQLKQHLPLVAAPAPLAVRMLLLSVTCSTKDDPQSAARQSPRYDSWRCLVWSSDRQFMLHVGLILGGKETMCIFLTVRRVKICLHVNGKHHEVQ